MVDCTIHMKHVSSREPTVKIQRGWLVVALGLSTLGASAPAFAQKLATDDLSLLPADSEMVGGLNFAQLQTTVLWKKYVAPLLAGGDFQATLNELKAKCKVDAMQLVTRISFGIKVSGSDGAPEGVIVAHGVPKARLVACYGLKGTKKLGADVTVDGDVVIVNAKDGRNVAFSFVDDSTALIVMGKNATRAGIKALATGQSGLKTSPAFVELYKKTSTTDTMWMLMNGNSKAFEELAKTGIRPRAVFGSIRVAHDISLDFRMRFATPEEAQRVAGVVQPQVQQAAAMFDKLVVTSDGPDVRVEIGIADAKLKVLMKQYGPTP